MTGLGYSTCSISASPLTPCLLRPSPCPLYFPLFCSYVFLTASLNSQSRLPHSTMTPALETSTHIDINTLFTSAQEPSANQLPSVDRLTHLFSRAMTMQ